MTVSSSPSTLCPGWCAGRHDPAELTAGDLVHERTVLDDPDGCVELTAYDGRPAGVMVTVLADDPAGVRRVARAMTEAADLLEGV